MLSGNSIATQESPQAAASGRLSCLACARVAPNRERHERCRPDVAVWLVLPIRPNPRRRAGCPGLCSAQGERSAGATWLREQKPANHAAGPVTASETA